ncbi:hypothetical protein AB2N04_11255 [Nitratireductor sp. GISD-1A_MAKvit]
MSAGIGDRDIIAYFGYGSLVNRDTHRTEIVEAMPAPPQGLASSMGAS